MRNSIRTRLTTVFIGLSIVPLLLVGGVLGWQSFTVQQRQALNLQGEVAQRVSTEVIAFFGGLEDQLRLTGQLQGLQSQSQEKQSIILSELLSYQDVFDKLILLDASGQERVLVSRTGFFPTLGNRSQADEYIVPKSTGETYYAPIRFEENGEPYVLISVPQIDVRSGLVSGMLIADVRLKKIWELIAGLQMAPGQSVYIVSVQSEKIIAHQNPSIVLSETTFVLPDREGIHPGLNGENAVLAFAMVHLGKHSDTHIGEQELVIVSEQRVADALSLAFNTIYITVGLIFTMFLISGGLGFFMVQQLVRPLQTLAAAAQAISAGDLTQQVNITTRDELGVLGQAFNSMTSRLRDLITTLEQRVADRTRMVETSAEVSRRLSTILDQRQLVLAVVEEVRRAFNYYHAHIYLFDETQEKLVMMGGTGEAGQVLLSRGHQIPKGRGLVGRAAETNRTVLVPDTGADPNWLANPLLPETRSEAAVPISIGERVLGVLDVQHNIVNGLSQQDADLLEAIANQVAVAVQNAMLYSQAQRQAERETLVNEIGQKIQVAGSVDGVLQVMARELGIALRARRAYAQLGGGSQGAEDAPARQSE